MGSRHKSAKIINIRVGLPIQEAGFLQKFLSLPLGVGVQ